MVHYFPINTLSIVAYAFIVIVFCDPCQAQVQSLSNNAAGNVGSSFGSSGLGNNNSGGSQFGMTPLGTVQNLNPQNGFIGRTDAGQDAFIGRSNAQNAANNANQNRNFNRTTNGGSQNQLNTGRNALLVPEFRPQLRVAFKAPSLPPVIIKTSMGRSLDRIKERNERLRDVQFTLNDDQSITLRGQVKSASAKKLAGFLAMLEPGVRKVKNELTVSEK